MRTTPSATMTAAAAASGEDDDRAVPVPSDHPDIQAGVIRDADVQALGGVPRPRERG